VLKDEARAWFLDHPTTHARSLTGDNPR